MNTDIFQALFPIYHLSKLCGLLPVRFTKQANGRYEGRLSVIDVIYSITVFGLVMGSECWGLWREMKDGFENSLRLKSRSAVIPVFSDIFSVIILAAIAILGSPFRWKRAQNVLNKLAEVDEMLGIVAPKKTRRNAIVLSVCSQVCLLLNTILDMCMWIRRWKADKNMEDKGPINYFPIYVMYMIILTLEIQYNLIAYNIGQRFVRLNKCLESVLENGKMADQFGKDLGLVGNFKSREQATTCVRRKPGNLCEFKVLKWHPTTFEIKNVTNKISQLVMVHSTLCDTVISINDAFGLAMLAVILTSLLHLVITSYFLILGITGSGQLLLLAGQTLWCILHVAKVFIVIQPTYSACAQSKKTAIIVSQLISSNPNDECRKELEVFSLQLLHRPLDFTVCGLFSLDRSLATSIAGAVATYLVILIQFQKEEYPRDNTDNILKNVMQMLKESSSIGNFTLIKLSS